MQTVGIKDLQVNPAILTKSLENNELSLITKRSKPIGVAVSFNDNIITNGLKNTLLINSFKNGDLSLGQLSKALGKEKREIMKLLSMMGVDIVDYDLNEDLEVIQEFL